MLVYFFLPLLRMSQTIEWPNECCRIKQAFENKDKVNNIMCFTIYSNVSIILYYIHDIIDDVFRDSINSFDWSRIKYDVSIPRRVNNFLTLRKSNTILTCCYAVVALLELASHTQGKSSLGDGNGEKAEDEKKKKKKKRKKTEKE
uniref:Uncharacterized protein n=1 Tax=Vespula pensylvanica TaxID=30213 RepID=A0A834P834_VESPE|nr:hypothetical protein H0235_004800 [Vespula pensylvanica]